MSLSVEELSILARRGQLPDAERRRLELALRNSVSEHYVHQAGRAFDGQVVCFTKDAEVLSRVTDRALERLMGSREAAGAAGTARVSERWLVPKGPISKGPISRGPISRGPISRGPISRGTVRWLWAFGLGTAAAAGYFGHSLSSSDTQDQSVLSKIPTLPAQLVVDEPATRAATLYENQPGTDVNSGERDEASSLADETATSALRSGAGQQQSPRVKPLSPASRAAEPPSFERASESAATLFTRANAARRAGSVSTAIELYGTLKQRFPRSAEAVLACVSLGHLFLMQGAPELALEQFSAYLGTTSPGSVAEEALRGKAVALRRLGRRSEEMATWQLLLARFPRTVFRSTALERLALGKQESAP